MRRRAPPIDPTASGRATPPSHLAVLLALCLAVFAAPAWALRCGNDVVGVGDTTFELLEACGEPTLVERFDDRLPYRTFDTLTGEYYTDWIAQPYDVWTYNFGPRRFVQRIIIKEGKIYRIESRGYGY